MSVIFNIYWFFLLLDRYIDRGRSLVCVLCMLWFMISNVSYFGWEVKCLCVMIISLYVKWYVILVVVCNDKFSLRLIYINVYRELFLFIYK